MIGQPHGYLSFTHKCKVVTAETGQLVPFPTRTPFLPTRTLCLPTRTFVPYQLVLCMYYDRDKDNSR